MLRRCGVRCAVPAPALTRCCRSLPDGAAVLMQKPMGETLAEAAEILADLPEQGADGGGELSVAVGSEYDGGAGAGRDRGAGRSARHGGVGERAHAVGALEFSD